MTNSLSKNGGQSSWPSEPSRNLQRLVDKATKDVLHVIQKSTGEEPNFFDKFDSKLLVWGVTAFDENRIYSAVGNPTKITFPHRVA